MPKRCLGPTALAIRNHRSGRIRAAVTLIELLIVMGILTILATVSLTTVKGLLRDQKVPQAAILVEQYIESARVRALTNRRPVAVFLERSAVLGSGVNPVSANFTVTRLTIGEVFPPYVGDELNVTASLIDTDSNGYADQATFDLASVFAGFGQGGFIQTGDTIEFDGYEGQFPILSISELNGPPAKAQVTFANPPLIPNTTLGMVPPTIPVTAAGVAAKFRVYRRPTKSLVGAITLPRGTCIDLAASGLGATSAGAGDDSIPFGLTAPPISGSTVPPRAYSRLVILFSGDGRLSSVFAETSDGTTKFPITGGLASQILYLMVGRSEQVLPATEVAPDLSSPLNRKLAVIQRSVPSDADPVNSNLMDASNVWIICNPFTGEIKSSPVTQVPDSVLTSTLTDLTNNPATAVVQPVVRASRALARSGMREQQ